MAVFSGWSSLLSLSGLSIGDVREDRRIPIDPRMWQACFSKVSCASGVITSLTHKSCVKKRKWNRKRSPKNLGLIPSSLLLLSPPPYLLPPPKRLSNLPLMFLGCQILAKPPFLRKRRLHIIPTPACDLRLRGNLHIQSRSLLRSPTTFRRDIQNTRRVSIRLCYATTVMVIA